MVFALLTACIGVAVSQFLFSGSFTPPSISGSVTTPSISGSFTPPSISGSVTTPSISGSVTTPGGQTPIGMILVTAIGAVHMTVKAAIVAACGIFQTSVRAVLRTVVTLVTGVLCPGGTGGASVNVNFNLRDKRQICQGIDIAKSLVDTISRVLRDAHNVIEFGVDSGFSAIKVAAQSISCSNTASIKAIFTRDIEKTIRNAQDVYTAGFDEAIIVLNKAAGSQAANSLAQIIKQFRDPMDAAVNTLVLVIRGFVNIVGTAIDMAVQVPCAVPFLNMLGK